MERQRKIKYFLIVALTFLSTAMTLGFAAFSTTLSISSNASVTPNSDSFAVKFSTNQNSLVVGPVQSSSKSGDIYSTTGVIDNSTTPTLTNLSATFTSPGQYVEYTVYARNEGEYTAYLNNINYIGNKTCTASTGTTDSLVQSACNSINVKVTIGSTTYTDTTPITSHVLAKNTGEAVKVRLEYASNGTPVDGAFSITFPSIALVYSTVDDSSIQPSTQNKACTYVDSEDDTGNAIGEIDLSDVVTCGTENFYVMSNESGKVTMLSMYNLRVGYKVVWDSLEYDEYDIEVLTNQTGIQDSDAKGAVTGYVTWIGTTDFSDMDSTYSGSIVEGYVNNYKTYLTNMRVNVSAARLITKSELEKLGCSSSNYRCSSAPSWVYSTTYWSGSAYASDFVWFVHSDARFDASYYIEEYESGVRPVIEISESEIKKD